MLKSPPFYTMRAREVRSDIERIVGCKWRRITNSFDHTSEDVCIVPASTFQVVMIQDKTKVETVDILIPNESPGAVEKTLQLFSYFFPTWREYETWEKEGIEWANEALAEAQKYRYKKFTKIPGGVVVLVQNMSYPTGRGGGISVIFTRDLVAKFYRFPDEADGDPMWGEYIRRPECPPPLEGRFDPPKYCGY